mmetsp:Transcript_7772/g.14670  ORF Transcript_7772/g.14670 Transcript_7772/m.14670 type:complete len:227 (-) Transcript_7772:1321-2001(-)
MGIRLRSMASPLIHKWCLTQARSLCMMIVAVVVEQLGNRGIPRARSYGRRQRRSGCMISLSNLTLQTMKRCQSFLRKSAGVVDAVVGAVVADAFKELKTRNLLITLVGVEGDVAEDEVVVAGAWHTMMTTASPQAWLIRRLACHTTISPSFSPEAATAAAAGTGRKTSPSTPPQAVCPHQAGVEAAEYPKPQAPGILRILMLWHAKSRLLDNPPCRTLAHQGHAAL